MAAAWSPAAVAQAGLAGAQVLAAPACVGPLGVPLLVRPSTVLRRHRDLTARRTPPPPVPSARDGRRRCTQSGALVLRTARENPSWEYALLACDFFETVTLSGARLYVLAVIEHTGRRIRALGATGHPTASQRRMREAGHTRPHTPRRYAPARAAVAAASAAWSAAASSRLSPLVSRR